METVRPVFGVRIKLKVEVFRTLLREINLSFEMHSHIEISAKILFALQHRRRMLIAPNLKPLLKVPASFLCPKCVMCMLEYKKIKTSKCPMLFPFKIKKPKNRTDTDSATDAAADNRTKPALML